MKMYRRKCMVQSMALILVALLFLVGSGCPPLDDNSALFVNKILNIGCNGCRLFGVSVIEGSWSGTTEEGLGISFTVEDGAVVGTYSVRFRTHFGSVEIKRFDINAEIDNRGRFSVSGDNYHFEGNFSSSDNCSGTAKDMYMDLSGRRVSVGPVSWSASPDETE